MSLYSQTSGARDHIAALQSPPAHDAQLGLALR